jgi:hypothetical protein
MPAIHIDALRFQALRERLGTVAEKETAEAGYPAHVLEAGVLSHLSVDAMASAVQAFIDGNLPAMLGALDNAHSMIRDAHALRYGLRRIPFGHPDTPPAYSEFVLPERHAEMVKEIEARRRAVQAIPKAA